jgi:hypothetical protein
MPSPTIRIAAFALGALAAGSALAQELPGFSFIEVCRIDDTSAALRIVYQGGSCETSDGLEPRVDLDGTGGLVFVATQATAEVCAMQMIPNYVNKTIGLAPDTAELDVTVLGVTFEPQGRQIVPVLKDGAECSAAGESF